MQIQNLHLYLHTSSYFILLVLLLHVFTFIIDIKFAIQFIQNKSKLKLKVLVCSAKKLLVFIYPTRKWINIGMQYKYETLYVPWKKLVALKDALPMIMGH